MKNDSEALRQARVAEDAAEHARDWALAAEVQRNVSGQLKSTRGANAALTEGLSVISDVARYDLADAPDAQSLARLANVMYEVNTSARAGDWTWGNFLASEAAYEAASRREQALEAQQGAQEPSGKVVVGGRSDVLAEGSLGKSLITAQPIMPKAETPPSAGATNEAAGKKPVQRRNGFGLNS